MNTFSLSRTFVVGAALLVSLACDTADAGDVAEQAALRRDPTAKPDAASDSLREALLRRADLGRIKGSDTATTWLVVLSDFQCPYCKVWHDETQPLIERDYVRTGKIRMAHLNLPISTHRNAWPAHEAAMCAAEQGAFWPVADALFATQKEWKGLVDARDYFDKLTRTITLDHARLTSCIKAGELKPLIQADYDRAARLGVGSTPSFYIGDRLLVGAQPYSVFKSALDAALAK